MLLQSVLRTSLTYSRFGLKNVKHRSGFVSKLIRKCSTTSAETATVPTSSATDSGKKFDQNESHEEEIGSGAIGGISRSSYVKTNSPATVYEFFKRLVDGRSNVNSKSVLTKSLRGVIEGNFSAEFVDYYFDHWLKEFRKTFEDEASKHFVPGAVNDLGKINVRSGGGLSKKFNAKDFQYFESKFSLIPERDVTLDTYLFFNGLGNLTLGNHTLIEKLVSDELVSKCLAIFEKPNEINPLKQADFFVGFFGNLPLLHIVLNKVDLSKVCQYFIRTYDDEKFTNIGDSCLEYYRRIRNLHQFADAFLMWNINADEINEKIWNSWFAAVKKLLTIDCDLQYPRFQPRDQLADLSEQSFIRASKLADETLHLCGCIVNVAMKFNKFDRLTDLNDVWLKVLRKNCAAASTKHAKKFVKLADINQLCLNAKRALDSKAIDFVIVDDDVAKIISRKMKAIDLYFRNRSPNEQRPRGGQRMVDADDERFYRGGDRSPGSDDYRNY